MKRVAVLFSLLLALTVAASAQLGMSGVGGGFGVASGGGATLTLTASPAVQNPAFGVSSIYTFSSASLGTPAGLTCVGIAISGGSSVTISSVVLTTGLISLTKVADSQAGTNARIAQAWCGASTVSSDTITVTAGGGTFNVNFIGIVVYKWTGSGGAGTPQILSETSVANATTPAITVASGGSSIIVDELDGATIPTLTAGTNNVIDVQTNSTTVFAVTGGHISTSGSQTPAFNGVAFNNTAMVAVPVNP